MNIYKLVGQVKGYRQTALLTQFFVGERAPTKAEEEKALYLYFNTLDILVNEIKKDCFLFNLSIVQKH